MTAECHTDSLDGGGPRVLSDHADLVRLLVVLIVCSVV